MKVVPGYLVIMLLDYYGCYYCLLAALIVLITVTVDIIVVSLSLIDIAIFTQ